MGESYTRVPPQLAPRPAAKRASPGEAFRNPSNTTQFPQGSCRMGVRHRLPEGHARVLFSPQPPRTPTRRRRTRGKAGAHHLGKGQDQGHHPVQEGNGGQRSDLAGHREGAGRREGGTRDHHAGNRILPDLLHEVLQLGREARPRILDTPTSRRLRSSKSSSSRTGCEERSGEVGDLGGPPAGNWPPSLPVVQEGERPQLLLPHGEDRIEDGRVPHSWRNSSGSAPGKQERDTQGEEGCTQPIPDGHLQGQEERKPRWERGALDGADHVAQHVEDVQVEVPASELPTHLPGDGWRNSTWDSQRGSAATLPDRRLQRLGPTSPHATRHSGRRKALRETGIPTFRG